MRKIDGINIGDIKKKNHFVETWDRTSVLNEVSEKSLLEYLVLSRKTGPQLVGEGLELKKVYNVNDEEIEIIDYLIKELQDLNVKNEFDTYSSIWVNIKSYLNEIELSQETDNPILIFIKGIFSWHSLEFEAAIKHFEQVEKIYGNEINPLFLRETQKFLADSKTMRDKLNKFVLRENWEVKNHILLIRGVSNYDTVEYLWQDQIDKIINDTNLKLSTSNQGSYNSFIPGQRLVRNIVSSLHSNMFRSFKKMIRNIHPKFDVMILFAHGDNQGNFSLETSHDDINTFIDKSYKFKNFFKFLAKKNFQNKKIILFNCFGGESIKGQQGNYYVSNKGDMNFNMMAPFLHSFFTSLLFEVNFKDAFNRAKNFAILFSARAKSIVSNLKEEGVVQKVSDKNNSVMQPVGDK